jgi:hypothetical protein
MKILINLIKKIRDKSYLSTMDRDIYLKQKGRYEAFDEVIEYNDVLWTNKMDDDK